MSAKKQNFTDIFKKDGMFINYLIPFLTIILQFMTSIHQKRSPMKIPFKLMT